MPRSDRALVAGRETAQRFAQRARSERRRKRGRWLAAGAVVVLIAAALVLVGRSSLLRVRTVEVTGAKRQPIVEVLAAAAVPARAPMWKLDLAAVRGRVAALPRVRTVSVSRQWPRNVRITISERLPVAVVTVPVGNPLIVDSGAAEIERLPTAPEGLLPVTLTAADLPDTAEARRPLVTAALTVAVALPAPVRARTARLLVASSEQVELVFTDGTRVQWGSADRSDRKAAVLTALLVTPHASYDVRAPETPAVR
ncbi:MAG: FtsQ-type POTRA domain-containing protein [Pseudonocardiales bacterium]